MDQDVYKTVYLLCAVLQNHRVSREGAKKMVVINYSSTGFSLAALIRRLSLVLCRIVHRRPLDQPES